MLGLSEVRREMGTCWGRLSNADTAETTGGTVRLRRLTCFTPVATPTPKQTCTFSRLSQCAVLYFTGVSADLFHIVLRTATVVSRDCPPRNENLS